VLIGLAACAAASGAHQATAARDPMKEFQFVVGIWKPAPAAGKTAKYREELTYAAILEGRWVISQQILRDKEGKIVYRDCAIYGIDPDAHKLLLHAYDTHGSMDRTREVEAQPGKWILERTVYGSKRFRDYRYTLTKIDDHMRVFVELKKDGKYEKWSDMQ